VQRAPEEGIPELTADAAALADARGELLAVSGPLAVDTERAQSFRYTGKAYLIQLRRGDGETILIDPIPFEGDQERADFSTLAADLADVEWIIHAASNDLPCLAEVKFTPKILFDTELAGRLLGYEKVNLAQLMADHLGVSIIKNHGAENWSVRPLPPSWRSYAALDVEHLAELRDVLAQKLKDASKWEFAQEEFAYLVAHAYDPLPVYDEPWRRTSGMHQVHGRRALAIIREVWLDRDQLAQASDTAPGRLLADKTLTAYADTLASRRKVDARFLRSLPDFRRPATLAHLKVWVEAINRALKLPESELPTRSKAKSPLPSQWAWKRTEPERYERYQRIRDVLAAEAVARELPLRNLLAPDALRQLIADVDAQPNTADIARLLTQLEVRPWQQNIVSPLIATNW
jgi:ribonuclease D